MAVSEDVWDQISRLNKFKDGRHIQDKIKNSLRSFTYSCIDLDLREFYTDRKKIRTLTELSKYLSISKPDKVNGIVVMKRSDYLSSVTSLFSDASRFKLLDTDPTPTRLNSLQSFLCTLLQRGEISQSDYDFLRPKAAHFGRAHGLPKVHKHYNDLPPFRPIIDTTGTPHYNVGKFLAKLLNPLAQNEYTLRDSFHAVSEIKSIPKELFAEGYRLVSFDVVSLFTNVPLTKTVKIILDRVFEEKLVAVVFVGCDKLITNF